MHIRAWAANALSGEVLGELRLAGSGDWSSHLEGGECTASISVGHLLRADGESVDEDAVARVVDLTEPGRRVLLVTDGQHLLGEWLIWERHDDDPGVLTVMGREWTAYPEQRLLSAALSTTDDQLSIAQTLLAEAFTGGQDVQIAIPQAVSGVTRTVDMRAGTPVAENLHTLMAVEDGFDWVVRSSVEWSTDGGRPARVLRSVEWGHPVLTRTPESAILKMGRPGARAGAVTQISRGVDHSRWASRVVGVGAGQVTATADAQPLADAVAVERQRLFSSISDPAEIARLAQGVVDAAQQRDTPTEVTCFADRLAGWILPGDSVQIVAAWTSTQPSGWDAVQRVGEVTFSSSGHEVTEVVLRVADPEERFPWPPTLASNAAGTRGALGGLALGGLPALPPAPSPPTMLAVDERVGVAPGDYAARSEVTFSWVAPTTNVDGSPLTDLAGFDVQWVLDHGKSQLGIVSLGADASSMDAAFSSPGHSVRPMVRAVNSAGLTSDWASIEFLAMSYGELDRAHIWGNLRDGVDELGTRADTLEARSDGQDSRLDSLEESDQVTDSEQAIQDDRLDALEQEKADRGDLELDQWRQDQQRRAGDQDLGRRVSEVEAAAERARQEAAAEARRQARLEQARTEAEQKAREYAEAQAEYARQMAEQEQLGRQHSREIGRVRDRVDNLEEEVRRAKEGGDNISSWAEKAEADKAAQDGVIGQLLGWIDELFGESNSNQEKGWQHDSWILSLQDLTQSQGTRIGAVEGEVVGARGGWPTLNQRINNAGDRIIAVESEVSTARGTHGSLGSRLTGMDGVSTGLGSRIGAVEGEVVGARGGWPTLNQRINNAGDRIIAAEGKLNDHAGWIDTLWPLLGRMNSAESSISSLASQMSGKASVSSVNNLASALSTLRDAVAALAAYTGSLRSAINSLHPGTNLPAPPTIPP